MRSKSLAYMPALDGLRAVSVLLVFAIHAFPTSGFPGAVGVDVFFVISGFLITRILLKEYGRSERIWFKGFYIRRLIRLYPPLIAMVVVTAACWWLLGSTPFIAAGRSVVALLYLGNIVPTLAPQLGLGWLAHTWSLAMEEQFYLVWPPLLYLALRRGVRVRTLVTVLAVLSVGSFLGHALTADTMPYNPIFRCGGLLVGSIAALLVQRRPWASRPLAYAGLAVFVAALAADAAGWISRTATLPIVTAVLPFIILFVAFRDGWLTRALSARWLVHLGVVSYAFYLWHYPILWALAESTSWSEPVRAAVGLPLSVAVAQLSLVVVERPTWRLKDRWVPVGSGQKVVMTRTTPGPPSPPLPDAKPLSEAPPPAPPAP